MNAETKTKIRMALVTADGVIDRVLLRVTASGFSPVIVLVYTFICMAIGGWIRGHL